MPATPAKPSFALPVPVATSIAPPDLTDSTLLDVDPDAQMSLDTVAVDSRSDVVYATAELPGGARRELKADVLRPSGDERLPLVVYLPGGAFLRCNKAMAFEARQHVAESGFVVASVEYRVTSDGATFHDSVRDVRAALAYLRSYADDFGIDPRAVALWGESAGGHVAALTGVTDGLPEFSDASDPARPGQLRAVIDAYGSSELSAIAADFDEAARLHYQREATHFSAYLGRPGAPFPEIPDAVRAADPATYATASAPPFLFLHGSEDMLVSPSQTQHVHQALRAAGADSTRYVLKGANHGDVGFLGHPGTGLPWTSAATMGVITGFLHSRLDATER
ncbi:alpha/beta hydrolase [Streptomyces sp. MBT62]|uniref:alpha/beta hydrolase n=1 Tax=Streptomyces sp. MBT62 TaxID=2800410 RepID=UPI00190B66A4|nr:alpha/beta hydrolase [Streptomyces sp. MBT62]MBK3567790.1 alpha/beta hydrolase [Streptomyces sp. MBT62]